MSRGNGLLHATALAALAMASPSAVAQDATAPQQVAQVTPQQQAAQTPVASQTGPTGGQNILEEVVVTSARKRTENVQNTPVAVTALSAGMLEGVHATNINDIAQLVPNLQMHEITGSTAFGSGIYLRGFGTSQINPAADPAIPVYVDGVYQQQVTGGQIDLFSNSAEVLRGPQGTLFGKNAPTGALVVNSIRPTEDFSGKAQLDYGSFNKTEARLLVNVPIIQDELAINVAGNESYLGNWYYNLSNNKWDAGGHNNKDIRVGVLWTPNDNLTWYATFGWSHYLENQVPLQSFATTDVRPPFQQETAACLLGGFCGISPEPYKYYSLVDEPSHEDRYGITSNIEYRFDAVTLTSVSGYQITQMVINQDFSRVPALFGTDQNDNLNYNSESEEIRLSSNKGGGLTLDDRLDWVLGGYYGRDRYGESQPVFVYGGSAAAALGGPATASFLCGPVSLSVCGINAPSEQGQLTESLAWFGHTIFDITDNWNLTFGWRQSWDHKDHNTNAATTFGLPNLHPDYTAPYFYQQGGFHNVSFEAGMQYRFDADKMVYFRFAQGYRSGGVQGTVNVVSPQINLTFQPETVNSYEVGAKTDWFDHRLRVNLAMFNNDYTNLQRNITVFLPAVTQLVINAGSATVRGIELESIVVATPELTLHANGGYITTTYHQFIGNLESGAVIGPYDESLNLGQKFPYTPKFSVQLGADYVHDWGDLGSTMLSANWHWQSAENLNDQTIAVAAQADYGTLDLTLRWDDPTDTYSVSFYGQNVTDERYKTYFVPAVGDIGTYGMPATWGMSLGAKF